MPKRETLIARIRQLGRPAETASPPAQGGPAYAEQDPIQALEPRIAHLEQLVQGLQDSVHREAKRQEKRIADLQARIEPGALNRALSKDARERGLQ